MDQDKADNYEIILKKINKMERDMAKQRSLKVLIPRAILNGIFASFGATVIFALILIVLSQLIKGADQIPLLNDIIERTKLEQIIDSQRDQKTNTLNLIN